MFSGSIEDMSKDGFMNLETKEYKLTWKINGFSRLSQDSGECITSPILHEYLPFRFKLYPRGVTTDHEDSLSFYLVSEGNRRISVKCTVSILSRLNTKLGTSSFFGKFVGAQQQEGVTCLIKREGLINLSYALIPDDILTIMCELSVGEEYNATGDRDAFVDETEKLSEDMKRLLETGEFSDAILSVEGERFKVHKGILAQRSTFFHSTFTQEMSKSNTFEVINVRPKTMKEILHYIYTGKCPRLDTMSRDIFLAADKFCLERLKKTCENALVEQLTVTNAVSILTLAKSASLRDRVVEFIISNFKEVTRTPEWREVENTDTKLTNDIYKLMLTQENKIIGKIEMYR